MLKSGNKRQLVSSCIGKTLAKRVYDFHGFLLVQGFPSPITVNQQTAAETAIKDAKEKEATDAQIEAAQARAVAEATASTALILLLNYGDAGYCQLHQHCAPEITNGADDESEMGAFHHLFQPQRIINLRTRLDEYLRFGLEAGILRILKLHII
ncbi:MAG: hypothetical protein IPM82_11985 [Saprospiraceae bacterium]|nr:hypothetical protein [Saprospiraceae bacterium]